MDNPCADYLQYISYNNGVNYDWNQKIDIGSPIRVRTIGNNLPDPDPLNNDWAGYSSRKNRNNTFDKNVINELASPMTLGDNEIYDSLIITERHDIIGTIIFEYSTSLLRHYHIRLLTGNANGKSYFYHSWWFIDFKTYNNGLTMKNW